MKIARRLLPFSLAAAVLVIAAPVLVSAQVNRSFVSTAGNAANTATNCQKAAPCRLWNEALTVTNSGGEIIALDDGGFGNPTITKSIILSGSSSYAGFLVPTGGAGVNINVPGGMVILRNLHFTGNSGSTSNSGVVITSGSLVIDRCNFQFLGTGLNATGSSTSSAAWTRVDVYESNFHRNGIGVKATGPGTQPVGSGTNTPAQLVVRLNGGNMTSNTIGISSEGRGYDNGTDLFNVYFFTQANGARTNIIGNGMNTRCTDPNSQPNNNPCNNFIPTYTHQSGSTFLNSPPN